MATDKANLPARTEDIWAKFPEDEYNRLLPSQTFFDNLSPMHRVKVEVLPISSDPRDGDVYEIKPGKYCFSKKTLAAISYAAAISVHPTLSGVEVHNPKDGYCRYKAVCVMKKADGEPHTIPGTYFIDREQDRADGIDKANIAKRQRFIVQLCETGAMNRAIREILALKGTYTKKELSLPFAIPKVVFVPDFKDPDVKKYYLEQGGRARMELFPERRLGITSDRLMIENGQTEELPADPPAVEQPTEDPGDPLDQEPEFDAIEAAVATFKAMDRDDQKRAFRELTERKGLDLGTAKEPSDLTKVWMTSRLDAYRRALTEGGE